MGIGYRIKEARENLGLTQTGLGSKVGVTGSAITNYEKETSHPKEQVIYKLMEVLGVDANYLFQDVVNIPKKINDVTLAEFEYIKKYRDLDSHGKEMVDFTLLKEWERSTIEVKQFNNNIIPEQINDGKNYQLNAAHAIEGASKEDQLHDDDIMDDENF